MLGIAVPTMVFSTAAMKVAIMHAARIRLRRPLTTAGVSDMRDFYFGRLEKSTP
jgi:hypothetical protein